MENARQYGDLMRERQPQTRSLRDHAKVLPKPFSIHLGIAALELILCAFC